MLCCDREEVSFAEAVEIARFLADVQRQRLAGSLERVASRLPTSCETVIVSGSGSFLARRLATENRRTVNSQMMISLNDQLSPRGFRQPRVLMPLKPIAGLANDKTRLKRAGPHPNPPWHGRLVRDSS